MVQSYFKKATLLRVTECLEMAMYSVFPVVRYQSERTCHVSYCPLLGEFKCECLRMESTWLPCHHIIIVLLALHFTEFPESLLLDRWNKYTKEQICGTYVDGSSFWNSQLHAKYATLVPISRQACEYSYRDNEEFHHLVNLMTSEAN